MHICDIVFPLHDHCSTCLSALNLQHQAKHVRLQECLNDFKLERQYCVAAHDTSNE